MSAALISHQQVYSSPLPPPEALAKYEQLQPGLVQKIIELTETQGNHRRELEAKHLEAQIKHQERRDCEAKLGQVFAFLIAILGIGGGIYIALQGYQAAGSIISALGLSGIVTPFIIGRQEKEKK